MFQLWHSIHIARNNYQVTFLAMEIQGNIMRGGVFLYFDELAQNCR